MKCFYILHMVDNIKKAMFRILAFAAAAVFGFCAWAEPEVQAPASAKTSPMSLQTTPKMRNETRYLVFLMERGHYLKTPVSELDAREFLREYMQNLDFFKLFFTAEDVQRYQDFFAPSVDIMLRQGTLLPAYSIYEKFLERAEARIAWIKKRMNEPFDLENAETFRPDRSKEDWPKDNAEADALWNKRLEYDIINQMIGHEDEATSEDELEVEKALDPQGKPLKKDIPESGESIAQEVKELDEERKEEPKTFEERLAEAKAEVLKRYERIVDNYRKTDPIEIQEIYLNTLSRLYDPHSAFLSEYYLEEFDISVRNALVGIGALLQDKDGYCTLAELMAGGPAEECKQLKPGDKIVAVGQETGPMVDVIGMKLRKTVKMIRGEEGTKVRLLIEPASNPSARKIVTLVRREIKLTTKLARAEIYTVPVGDKTVPIGVIDLPAFYGEGGVSEGHAKGFSTTKDVEELLVKLNKMGAQGLILDLRRNGGGFLNEAVDLAGLFIKTGPVVQVRDASGNTNKLHDENPKLVWDKPLIILVSRLSASAAEIVAGALQDHQRAIIVGDKSTHGKGTVQAVYHLENFDPEQKSAAKVTIQKWYAPSGASIQVKGVHSDIVLPSVYDYMEIGEEYKDYALKWDSISPDGISELWGYGLPKGEADALMKKLTELSKERQSKLEEFKVWNERINWVKKLQDKKDWSLNLKEREAELKADEGFNDKMKSRQKELAVNNFKKEEILLESAKETAAKEKALKDSEKEAAGGGKEKKSDDKSSVKSKTRKNSKFESLGGGDDEEDVPDFDVQLREALRIMSDWIGLVDASKSGDSKSPSGK